MTSTRNKNTKGNFELEFNENKAYSHTLINDTRIYKNNYLPGEGLLGGSFPLNIMANNQVDIETSLFGIGSTNLINPHPNTINLGDLNRLHSLNVSKKTSLVMPDPLVSITPFKY